MKKPISMVVLLGLVVLVSAACIPIRIEQSITVDRSIDLLPDLDEMPAGFYLDGDIGQLASNKELSRIFADDNGALAMFEELGRQGGWFVDYASAQKHLFGRQNDNLSIAVIVFDEEQGAQRYVDGAMKRETLRKKIVEPPIELSVPQLGDKSLLFLMDMPGDTLPQSRYTLFVSQKNIVFAIDAVSIRNGGDVDQMISIASKMLDKVE